MATGVAAISTICCTGVGTAIVSTTGCFGAAFLRGAFFTGAVTATSSSCPVVVTLSTTDDSSTVFSGIFFLGCFFFFLSLTSVFSVPSDSSLERDDLVFLLGFFVSF